jgi:site-specific DNA recombinase
MKFVIGGDSLFSRRSDPALVKLIGRARCWFEDLLSGRAHSMVDIGKREKLGKRYVSRIIRYAFLAPNIVEQIAGDHQPTDFTAESLLRGQAELPLAWGAQRKLLGFSQLA